MAETVLVTTHDLPLAGELRDGFRHEGYRVELFTRGEQVEGTGDPVLLVLTGGAGTAAARRHAEQASRLGLPVFAVVAPGDADAKAPVATAATTFSTPADAEEIVLVGTRAIERKRLRRVTGIVGETDAMVEVLERIVQIAPVDATVLVTGESGTGKELVARGIHALSRRRHRSFIPVNVAALSETLLESELFGHEKGAFTGAIDTRKGLFELASGGTIFLDEIGEMPPQTQTRLLRILEQQEFHRVGGQKMIRVNVRIIAATNRRLERLVVTGAFRKDLYYRLNVLTIALPPLRERRADIPRLVDTFVQEASERHDRGPFRGISPEAMEILVRHRWPGNVRELRNLVESMVVLTPGREIRPEDIPEDVRSGDGGLALVPVPEGELGQSDEATASLRPQLQFIFRTMMEMKVDIEDLRREFEQFQAKEHRERMLIAPRVARRVSGHGDASARADEIVYDRRPAREAVGDTGEAPAPPETGDPAPETGDPVPETGDPAPETGDPAAIAYQPGMTLEDMEREVIRAVLNSVGWNRREAAEILGIGERTLYRKVKKYGLDED